MTKIPPRSTSNERARRLLSAAEMTAQEEPGAVLYAHTVLCQTGMPYRNPGNDVREWERTNGAARLKVLAGEAMHPETGQFVQLGLPYGPKPRLILAHLNGEALRQQSPTVEIDSSLTAFVRRLRLDPKGRNIAAIKDQLARLAASSIRLGYVRDGRTVTVNSQVVTAFDLWFPRDGHRVLWPAAVRLSADYYDTLTRHAVPLHDEALVALSGNAMALDLYAWLAQRLHRIDPAKPTMVSWPALQAQFGWHYDRLTNFRPVFRRTLRMVADQYRGARMDLDGRGLTMWHSSTPIRGRTLAVIPKR